VHDRLGATTEDHRRNLPPGDEGPPRGRRFAADDYDILLIGHDGTRRSRGRLVRPRVIQLVQSPADVASVQVRDPDRVAWLSQTTLSVDETMQTVERLRRAFPNLLDPSVRRHLLRHQNRQQAVKEMAAAADLMLVVGSRNSSNSCASSRSPWRVARPRRTS
jgi:4-hydroxy-3-methylbut-2-enyl diphosphate reductase